MEHLSLILRGIIHTEPVSCWIEACASLPISSRPLLHIELLRNTVIKTESYNPLQNDCDNAMRSHHSEIQHIYISFDDFIDSVLTYLRDQMAPLFAIQYSTLCQTVQVAQQTQSNLGLKKTIKPTVIDEHKKDQKKAWSVRPDVNRTQTSDLDIVTTSKHAAAPKARGAWASKLTNNQNTSTGSLQQPLSQQQPSSNSKTSQNEQNIKSTPQGKTAILDSKRPKPQQKQHPSTNTEGSSNEPRPRRHISLPRVNDEHSVSILARLLSVSIRSRVIPLSRALSWIIQLIVLSPPSSTHIHIPMRTHGDCPDDTTRIPLPYLFTSHRRATWFGITTLMSLLPSLVSMGPWFIQSLITHIHTYIPVEFVQQLRIWAKLSVSLQTLALLSPPTTSHGFTSLSSSPLTPSHSLHASNTSFNSSFHAQSHSPDDVSVEDVEDLLVAGGIDTHMWDISLAIPSVIPLPPQSPSCSQVDSASSSSQPNADLTSSSSSSLLMSIINPTIPPPQSVLSAKASTLSFATSQHSLQVGTLYSMPGSPQFTDSANVSFSQHSMHSLQGYLVSNDQDIETNTLVDPFFDHYQRPGWRVIRECVFEENITHFNHSNPDAMELISLLNPCLMAPIFVSDKQSIVSPALPIFVLNDLPLQPCVFSEGHNSIYMTDAYETLHPNDDADTFNISSLYPLLTNKSNSNNNATDENLDTNAWANETVCCIDMDDELDVSVDQSNQSLFLADAHIHEELLGLSGGNVDIRPVSQQQHQSLMSSLSLSSSLASLQPVSSREQQHLSTPSAATGPTVSQIHNNKQALLDWFAVLLSCLKQLSDPSTLLAPALTKVGLSRANSNTSDESCSEYMALLPDVTVFPVNRAWMAGVVVDELVKSAWRSQDSPQTSFAMGWILDDMMSGLNQTRDDSKHQNETMNTIFPLSGLSWPVSSDYSEYYDKSPIVTFPSSSPPHTPIESHMNQVISALIACSGDEFLRDIALKVKGKLVDLAVMNVDHVDKMASYDQSRTHSLDNHSRDHSAGGDKNHLNQPPQRLKALLRTLTARQLKMKLLSRFLGKCVFRLGEGVWSIDVVSILQTSIFNLNTSLFVPWICEYVKHVCPRRQEQDNIDMKAEHNGTYDDIFKLLSNLYFSYIPYTPDLISFPKSSQHKTKNTISGETSFRSDTLAQARESGDVSSKTSFASVSSLIPSTPPRTRAAITQPTTQSLSLTDTPPKIRKVGVLPLSPVRHSHTISSNSMHSHPQDTPHLSNGLTADGLSGGELEVTSVLRTRRRQRMTEILPSNANTNTTIRLTHTTPRKRSTTQTHSNALSLPVMVPLAQLLFHANRYMATRANVKLDDMIKEASMKFTLSCDPLSLLFPPGHRLCPPNNPYMTSKHMIPLSPDISPPSSPMCHSPSFSPLISNLSPVNMQGHTHSLASTSFERSPSQCITTPSRVMSSNHHSMTSFEVEPISSSFDKSSVFFDPDLSKHSSHWDDEPVSLPIALTPPPAVKRPYSPLTPISPIHPSHTDMAASPQLINTSDERVHRLLDRVTPKRVFPAHPGDIDVKFGHLPLNHIASSTSSASTTDEDTTSIHFTWPQTSSSSTTQQFLLSTPGSDRTRSNTHHLTQLPPPLVSSLLSAVLPLPSAVNMVHVSLLVESLFEHLGFALTRHYDLKEVRNHPEVGNITLRATLCHQEHIHSPEHSGGLEVASVHLRDNIASVPGHLVLPAPQDHSLASSTMSFVVSDASLRVRRLNDSMTASEWNNRSTTQPTPTSTLTQTSAIESSQADVVSQKSTQSKTVLEPPIKSAPFDRWELVHCDYTQQLHQVKSQLRNLLTSAPPSSSPLPDGYMPPILDNPFRIDLSCDILPVPVIASKRVLRAGVPQMDSWCYTLDTIGKLLQTGLKRNKPRQQQVSTSASKDMSTDAGNKIESQDDKSRRRITPRVTDPIPSSTHTQASFGLSTESTVLESSMVGGSDLDERLGAGMSRSAVKTIDLLNHTNTLVSLPPLLRVFYAQYVTVVPRTLVAYPEMLMPTTLPHTTHWLSPEYCSTMYDRIHAILRIVAMENNVNTHALTAALLRIVNKPLIQPTIQFFDSVPIVMFANTRAKRSLISTGDEVLMDEVFDSRRESIDQYFQLSKSKQNKLRKTLFTSNPSMANLVLPFVDHLTTVCSQAATTLLSFVNSNVDTAVSLCMNALHRCLLLLHSTTVPSHMMDVSLHRVIRSIGDVLVSTLHESTASSSSSSSSSSSVNVAFTSALPFNGSCAYISLMPEQLKRFLTVFASTLSTAVCNANNALTHSVISVYYHHLCRRICESVCLPSQLVFHSSHSHASQAFSTHLTHILFKQGYRSIYKQMKAAITHRTKELFVAKIKKMFLITNNVLDEMVAVNHIHTSVLEPSRTDTEVLNAVNLSVIDPTHENSDVSRLISIVERVTEVRKVLDASVMVYAFMNSAPLSTYISVPVPVNKKKSAFSKSTELRDLDLRAQLFPYLQHLCVPEWKRKGLTNTANTSDSNVTCDYSSLPGLSIARLFASKHSLPRLPHLLIALRGVNDIVPSSSSSESQVYAVLERELRDIVKTLEVHCDFDVIVKYITSITEATTTLDSINMTVWIKVVLLSLLDISLNNDGSSVVCVTPRIDCMTSSILQLLQVLSESSTDTLLAFFAEIDHANDTCEYSITQLYTLTHSLITHVTTIISLTRHTALNHVYNDTSLLTASDVRDVSLCLKNMNQTVSNNTPVHRTMSIMQILMTSAGIDCLLQRGFNIPPHLSTELELDDLRQECLDIVFDIGLVTTIDRSPQHYSHYGGFWSQLMLMRLCIDSIISIQSRPDRDTLVQSLVSTIIRSCTDCMSDVLRCLDQAEQRVDQSVLVNMLYFNQPQMHSIKSLYYYVICICYLMRHVAHELSFTQFTAPLSSLMLDWLEQASKVSPPFIDLNNTLSTLIHELNNTPDFMLQL